MSRHREVQINVLFFCIQEINMKIYHRQLHEHSSAAVLKQKADIATKLYITAEERMILWFTTSN